MQGLSYQNDPKAVDVLLKWPEIFDPEWNMVKKKCLTVKPYRLEFFFQVAEIIII